MGHVEIHVYQPTLCMESQGDYSNNLDHSNRSKIVYYTWSCVIYAQ